MKNNRGYTLFEYVIVLVIIGIIAAIVVPKITKDGPTYAKQAMRNYVEETRPDLINIVKNACVPDSKQKGWHNCDAEATDEKGIVMLVFASCPSSMSENTCEARVVRN